MKTADLKIVYRVLTLVEQIDANYMNDFNNKDRADKHNKLVNEIKEILQPIINSHNPL